MIPAKYRLRIALFLASVAVLATLCARPLYSQAQTILFGSYMSAAKAVSVASDGSMNVTLAGGSVGAASGGTGQNSSAWSALVKVTSGTWAQYTGTACTGNDVIQTLSALGVASCVTPAGGTVTNLNLPASPSTSTTGNIYKGTLSAANRFIHNFWDQNGSGTDSNIFAGMLSGNFTMAYANANSSADRNAAFGYNTLTACTSCAANVAVGAIAAPALTTGFNNVFIGNNAGQFVTTGSANVIIGKDADFVSGATAVTGVTAVGIGACRDNTANQCTGVGDHALGQNTSGSRNVALGPTALGTNKTGDDNTAVGYGALGGGSGANNGQGNSVAIGSGAMTQSTTGSGRNIAIGFNAGFNQTTDDNVITIGFSAGRSGGTPITNSIFIGSSVTGAVSNTTIIGPTSITNYSVRGMQISAAGTISVADVGASSCGTTAATVVGNDNIGDITVGATAGTQCRVAFPVAAPTRRICTVNDGTTTIAVRSTYVDTTHTDFLGAFVAGDHVVFLCSTY